MGLGGDFDAGAFDRQSGNDDHRPVRVRGVKRCRNPSFIAASRFLSIATFLYGLSMRLCRPQVQRMPR
jgi:hypothetical protein